MIEHKTVAAADKSDSKKAPAADKSDSKKAPAADKSTDTKQVDTTPDITIEPAVNTVNTPAVVSTDAATSTKKNSFRHMEFARKDAERAEHNMMRHRLRFNNR